MSRKRRCWCKHSVGFCVFPRRITWTTLLPRRYPSNAPSSLISHFPIMPHFPEKLTSGTPRAAASKEPSHPQCQNTIATLNAMSNYPSSTAYFRRTRRSAHSLHYTLMIVTSYCDTLDSRLQFQLGFKRGRIFWPKTNSPAASKEVKLGQTQMTR